MTIRQALLLKIMEECDELSQRASKAIHFGLEEIQEGQLLTNEERLRDEFIDLIAATNMVISKVYIDPKELKVRYDKIHKYMDYSKSLGLVEEVDRQRLILLLKQSWELGNDYGVPSSDNDDAKQAQDKFIKNL